MECFAVAMNDAGPRHHYSSHVRFEITESELSSYRRAADYLNVNPVDVLSMQHEFGIFGGRAGGHVLELLRELRMPIVTTHHTILAEPSGAQKNVMTEIGALSERLVVMTAHGAALLRDVYGTPARKIDVIPHGIPAIPSASHSKDRLGVRGRPVILTFGLLSPDKGIEYVIDALPEVLARHPDAVYIVLGVTHPHVKEQHGETYRLLLESRAQRLGVDGSIIFHNRFVSQSELTEFLAAADIYVTPYLNAEQITSGTLAYAVGAGKAVISTPYVYARELLGDGSGILVPWRDSGAIAQEIVAVLGDETRQRDLRRRAAAHSGEMLWPAVAERYVDSFARAQAAHTQRLRSSFHARTLAMRPADVPEMDLAHLERLTDGTGLLQHAAFSVPRYEEGYCLDDNARALLLTAVLEDAGTEKIRLVRALGSRYLAFVRYAFNGETGRFRNFLSYGRAWMEEAGSEDSHGRAVWALGTVIGRTHTPGRQGLARDMLHAALPAVGGFTSPRAWAYTLLGIDEYLRAFEGESVVQAVGRSVAERLLDLLSRTRRDGWPWFEDRVTYCNARLPQALIVSGAWMHHPEMVAAGAESLAWLDALQRSPDGYFAPVGSNSHSGLDAGALEFDQQPVEAGAMVSACLDALRITGETRWAESARRAFNWFLGENHLHELVYDAATGGCRDGLHADRPNENQGAESTVSFLLALCDMRVADRVIVPSPAPMGILA